MAATKFQKTLLLFVSLFVFYTSGIYGKNIGFNKRNTKINYTPVVKTDLGGIRGEIVYNVENKKQYSSFKGIKYGEAKRFQPPTNPKHSNKDAVEHGPNCPQRREGILIGKEDCLYLNVYTPMTKFTFTKSQHPKKAVMVWIHGGMFEFGSGDSEDYGPDFIVGKDVILVTLNYRLGALGFLNWEDPRIPGNAGLKDQNLALKWVRRNIAKFGGDPDNVTIFGQSAGAVSVDMHILSPMSRGLFKRSIAMSGSVFCPWSFSPNPTSKADSYCKHIYNGKVCNHKPEDLLRENLEKLMKPNNAWRVLDYVKHKQLLYTPSIEKGNHTFIGNCFDEYIKNKNYYQGEHIMGFTYAESRRSYGTKIANTDAEMFFSNEMFVQPINLKQRYLIEYGSKPVYFYAFGFTPKDDLQPAHSADLYYLFYYADQYKQFTPDQMKMKNQLVTMFTNFAKKGNPSIQSTNLIWNPSDKTGKYLDIAVNGIIQMKNNRPNYQKKGEAEKKFDSKRDLCSDYEMSVWDYLIKGLTGYCKNSICETPLSTMIDKHSYLAK